MMLTTPAASQKQAFPLAGTLNRLSLSELHTKHRDSPSLPVRRNLWIKLNCAETEKLANSLILAQSCRAGSGVIRLLEIEESTFAIGGSWTNSLILSRNAQSVYREIKGEQYSGSPEHDCYSGSVVIRNGCNNENQQVITCSQLSPLVGVKLNQQVTGKEKGSAENTTLEMVPFLIHEENQQPPTLDDGASQHISTCETFVGQSSGAALDFLRWRRLISPLAAAIKKPAVLSSFSLTCSINSKSSSGSLTETCKDLLFRLPVAITESPYLRWCSVCTKYLSFQALTWCSLCNRLVVFTLLIAGYKNSEAQQCANTSRASIHNVNEAYTMEYSHSTQTHPKFQYLFLAVHRSDLNAKPHRESVTAHSEQDARRSLDGQFVLFFAGRLPEVSHV